MYKIEFIVNKNDAEEFSDQLFSSGAQSISTQNHTGEKVKLIVLCEDPDLFGQYINLASEVTELHDNDWKYNYLEDFKGFEINKSIYISSIDHHKNIEKDYEHIILLDPRDAFGDGRHATTRMCIELLQNSLLDYNKNNKKISLLDIGTGTGILAIAAASMGVYLIDAIDNEAESITRAKENMSLNKFTFHSLEHVDIANYKNTIQYDIVIANLLTDILLKNLSSMKSLMKDDGVMIISGISDIWECEIETAVHDNGLFVKEKVELDQWAAYVLDLTPGPSPE